MARPKWSRRQRFYKSIEIFSTSEKLIIDRLHSLSRQLNLNSQDVCITWRTTSQRNLKTAHQLRQRSEHEAKRIHLGLRPRIKETQPPAPAPPPQPRRSPRLQGAVARKQNSTSKTLGTQVSQSLLL